MLYDKVGLVTVVNTKIKVWITRKQHLCTLKLDVFTVRREDRNHFFQSVSAAFFECDSTMPPTAVTVHFKACTASINNAPGVGVQRVISPSALLRQNNSIRCLICHLTNVPLKGPQLPPTIGPIAAAAWLPASHAVWHGSVAVSAIPVALFRYTMLSSNFYALSNFYVSLLALTSPVRDQKSCSAV